MKAVLQRVSFARVTVDGVPVGEIGRGLLILLGIAQGDTPEQCRFLAGKIASMRIFEDAAGKMNRSLCDIGGHALVVSQFTLCAEWRHGRRPSFTGAAAPADAAPLVEQMISLLRDTPGISLVASGRFGADMQVSLLNDGPVTMVLDTAAL